MKRSNNEKIKVIGLTGSIGCGKSTVAKLLEQDFHACVVIADEIGYMAMKPGEYSYQEIVDAFGTSILEEDGTINRRKLADMVFQDDTKLEKLNSIIHPYVHRHVLQVIEEVRKSKSNPYVVVESAILIEAGYENICDEIWFVIATDQVRRDRLKSSRGYSDEKIDSIVAKQMATTEYDKYATGIINNNGDLREVSHQLELLLV